MRVLLPLITLLAFVLTIRAAEISGTYKGTWSGDNGGGDFVITIDSHDAAHPKAEISFTVSGDDVKCRDTSITVTGSKVNVVCKFELDGADLQSTITGELQGKTLQGSYETKSVTDGSEVDAGTWKTGQIVS